MKSVSGQKANLESGLALVQVLLISGLISILLLIMVASSQSAQRRVISAEQAILDLMGSYSVLNQINFVLLTENLIATEGNTSVGSLLKPRWNFYGQPFEFNGYEIRIQNSNSLVNILNIFELTRLLQYFGLNEAEARRLADNLARWQMQDMQDGALISDSQANAPKLSVQHLKELELIPGWSTELVESLAPYLTFHGEGMLNPLYAPSDLLHLVVSDAEAEILRDLRTTGEGDAGTFVRIAGLEADEFTGFWPGPSFRIHVKHANTNGRVLLQEAIYQPHHRDALSVREFRVSY